MHQHGINSGTSGAGASGPVKKTKLYKKRCKRLIDIGSRRVLHVKQMYSPMKERTEEKSSESLNKIYTYLLEQRTNLGIGWIFFQSYAWPVCISTIFWSEKIHRLNVWDSWLRAHFGTHYSNNCVRQRSFHKKMRMKFGKNSIPFQMNVCAKRETIVELLPGKFSTITFVCWYINSSNWTFWFITEDEDNSKKILHFWVLIWVFAFFRRNGIIMAIDTMECSFI